MSHAMYLFNVFVFVKKNRVPLTAPESVRGNEDVNP